MKQRLIFIIALLTLMATATSVFAQTEYKPVKIKNKITSNNYTRYKGLKIEKDSLGSFMSRLSVSTNFVDWMLFTPNIGFDFDIGDQSKIGAQSIYLNFKYKPDFNFENKLTKDTISLVAPLDKNTLGTLTPFSYWSGRIEYRWHFRWNEHPGQRRGLVKPALGLYNLFYNTEKKSEAMALAMESSQLKRPEMIGGRHYVGIFAEYMSYILNTKLDLVARDNIKDGYAFSGGLSMGYEFPAFFNKNHYWQFHIGANIGVMYSPYDKYSVDKNTNTVKFAGSSKAVLPMVTELKFGMTFRKNSVIQKYWKPSDRIQLNNIAENREMQALIDSITDNYSTQVKIFLTVPKAGDDLSIKTPLEKKDVIKAIREQTKMPLAAANFVNDTIFPIKRLDDYTITYRFKKAINKYNDELEEYTDVVFKFRVELEGRNAAEKQKQSLLDAIQKFRNEKGIPVLYAQSKPRSGDRKEIEGYVPWTDVTTLFSRIWGKTIPLHQLKGVSQRVGSGVVRPVDEKGINRRSRYTVSIMFHPQVVLDYESDPTLSQFEVQFRGESQGLSNYNKINGHRLIFERAYKGGDEFTPEISASDISEALKKDGINVDVSDIEVSPGLNKFGQRYNATIFLQAGYVANISFIVNDKGGLERAKSDFNSKLNPWIKSRKWPEIVIKGAAQDPRNVNIDERQIISAFTEASGYKFADYQFLDYCVDNEYVLMQDGRYRAYAKIQLHREFSTVPKIPYYVRFDNSEAERLAREKAEREEAERIAREKAEAERIAREKAEAERIAREKAEAERLAREEAERIAREKAEAERIAREKAEAERLAREEAERIAREKAEKEAAERLAREKFVADSIAAVQAELERLAKLAHDKHIADSIAAAQAELERIAKAAREKHIADSIAAAQAELERLAKVEAERIAREKAEQEEAERLAKEKAERLAKEKAAREEAERIAKEKAEAERLAKEKAAREEAERIAKEKAEAERIARENAAKANQAEEEEEDIVVYNNIVNNNQNNENVEIEKKQEQIQETKQEEKKEERAGTIVVRQQGEKKYVEHQTVEQPRKNIPNTESFEKAKEDFDTKVKPWLKAKKKMPEIIFRGDARDPKELNVTANQIITAFRKASDYVFKAYHFVDFCVDNEYKLMPDGRYQAHAKIQLHNDLEVLTVEYYIRFAY